MNYLFAVLGVLVVAAVVALVVMGPKLRQSGDEAKELAITEAGGPSVVRLVEMKAVGHGSQPDEAGGLRGIGVLASSPTTLAFVTWKPQKVFTIDKSTITGIVSAAGDVAEATKSMIEITFTGPSGPVTASFRMPDPADWLDELGYDWGPEGRPVAVDDD